MGIRIYLRRSKSDEGKQQFSLDVQRAGCHSFIAERLQLAGAHVAEYMDDGKAGDDFRTRAGMRAMILDSKPGDIIICRDQSRLGRDAIEVTLAIRDLVRDRACRLFYYVTGQEVQFANAIDQAMTFIQGTGHQMELEAVRSRTREALRSRVRQGRVAGGRCFGYQLERHADESGRGYTLARVDEDQAVIVRRVFELYLQGTGLKGIARTLNRDGVAPPTIGRRNGSGSWMASGIRSMLKNPRYRGVYMHGRVKKVRRGGRLHYVKADPSEVITVEVPEWQIVDDNTWFAVQERFTRRAPSTRHSRPAAKYPLTSIARCAHCGSAIGCALTKRKGGRVRAYACTRHRERGGSVCPVAVHQPMEEVESALVQCLQEDVLIPDAFRLVREDIALEIEAQTPRSTVDIAELKAQLAQLRLEQGKLARAVALSDEIPELVRELDQRSARIRVLGKQLEAAARAPEEVARLIADAQDLAEARLHGLRESLARRSDLRDVFLAMFPDGLKFSPATVEFQGRSRRVWQIEGVARLGGVPIGERPQRDLNPCRRRERPVS